MPYAEVKQNMELLQTIKHRFMKVRAPQRCVIYKVRDYLEVKCDAARLFLKNHRWKSMHQYCHPPILGNSQFLTFKQISKLLSKAPRSPWNMLHLFI